MSASFDKDLAAMIEAEYNALKGTVSPEVLENSEADAVVEATLKAPPIPPAEAHGAWPKHAMFSEVFGGLPRGKRDLPVPQFEADDWPEQARAMIPALPSYWVHNLDVMYGIALSVLCGDTRLLVGPTGTGKTSAEFAFAAMCCIPVWVTSCYQRMEHTDFVGSASLRADADTGANITEYNPTQLVNSLRYGGLCLIDEAMRSPTLMAIQSLLEDKHTLVLADADGLEEHERVLIAPKGKWWVSLTDNTCGTGDHTGSYNAEVQDLSTLDRITTTVFVDYNPPKVEMQIIEGASPGAGPMASKMVAVAGEARKAYVRGAVLQTMSMRALLSWADKYTKTGDLAYSFSKAYAAKLDPESLGVVREIWQQVIGEELAI
jgi:MoxR-like ATPase